MRSVVAAALVPSCAPATGRSPSLRRAKPRPPKTGGPVRFHSCALSDRGLYRMIERALFAFRFGDAETTPECASKTGLDRSLAP
jgi:hypothetical protein